MKTNPPQEQPFKGLINPTPDPDKCLDAQKLYQLEQEFRQWVNATPRRDVRFSRQRILIIFLLIRYTGAKLNEVLRLDPFQDIDMDRCSACFGRPQAGGGKPCRSVLLPETLCLELKEMISDPDFKAALEKKLNMDPGFVRRKFYERAEACGIAKQQGAPEILRRSRAVELMQNHMPLPAVQTLLGHSTPNVTSAYVSFSEEDIQQTIQLFMDRESARKTSARNSFFGKVSALRKGDIQSRVELLTPGGHRIVTIITNDSVQRLKLKPGKLITAEVKAPWVTLQKNRNEPSSSADNQFSGIVEKITQGKIVTEFIARILDGTRICSLVTTESSRQMALSVGDTVWVCFSSFSVVVLSD